MKIASLTIKNFRSIRETVISGPINDVWTFIGQNNAGKSSIFQAIRAFYGDYDVVIEDFCRTSVNTDAPIEITIEYILDVDEIKQLPDYYKLPGNKLRVVCRFTRQKLKGEYHGYEIQAGQILEREEEFFGQKNVLIGKLGEVIYVPAVKELGEELKKTKSSIFTKLISRILSETLTSLESWNGLVEHAQKFANDLRSPIKDSPQGEVKSVHEIENKLGEMLESWQLKPQIIVSPPTPENIILSGAQLKLLGESGQEENPLSLGSGAQRSVVNSLLLLWAQVEGKKSKTDKKKFNAQLTLLLYEEPEALLHYDQIKKLSKYLEEIAAAPVSQVMACTHSPDFVSTKRSALDSVIRLLKKNHETSVYKPSAEFLEELRINQNDFDFILWLNPDRNTMFFVDKVILVEGSADKVFLNYLIQEKEINKNVYVVDCGYKGNIPRFMKLCTQFGIHHSVMFDRDLEKVTTEVNHAELNKSIEDTKSLYTLDIKSFPDDLEKYIGFDLGGTYNKPIKMLRQLREQKLSAQHEQEFITFITSA